MNMKSKTKITDQLKKAINESGLSRFEIARRSGVEESALSRFVNGKRSLVIESVDRLADVLGLSLISTKKRGRTK